jgi:hypothetical protein
MMTYRSEVRGIAKESWWTLGKVLGYVVLPVFALSAVLFSLGVFGSVASAPGRVVKRTMETDNILYNYEWFKRQYQQVGAVDGQIGDAKADLDEYASRIGNGDVTFQQEAEYSRLRSILTGLRNQRRNYVAEYNARARMANRSLFMGRDLPPEMR